MALGAALLLLPGCGMTGITDPVMCLAVIKRAVEVEVRDAETGAPAAHGAVGTVRDGAFVETLQVIGWVAAPSPEAAVMLGGADERPGVYTVRVEKQGYRPWERTGVNARRGPCGVVTVRLQANLERS